MDYPINLVPLLEYAVSYTEKICDKFFADKETITGKDLATLTPIKQINAFLVRAVFEAWQSEATQLKSPFFNYDSKEVKEKFNSLMQSLAMHVTIRRDDFESILEKAVIDTLRLTFRPAETLLQYLEKLDKQVPIDRLLKPQLKYLKLHPKFIKAIHQEFTDVDEVKRKKLLKIVEKMAKDGHLFDLPYETMKVFNQTLPIRIGEIVPTWSDSEEEDEHDAVLYAAPAVVTRGMGAIEAETLQGFEEKTAHYEEEDYLPEDEDLAVFAEEDMLSEEEVMGDERPITEEDMKGLPPKDELEEIVNATTVEFIEAPQTDGDTSIANLFGNEPSLSDIDTEETEDEEALPAIERVSFSQPKEPQPENEEAPIHEEGISEEKVIETSSPIAGIEEGERDNDKPKSLLDKLQEAQEEEEEEAKSAYSNIARPASNASKIKGTIPLNLKFRYLNELFDGNNAAFEEAIELIDESPDYHAAVAVVKDKYIRPYGWDLGEDTTREFLSMISRKFE